MVLHTWLIGFWSKYSSTKYSNNYKEKLRQLKTTYSFISHALSRWYLQNIQYRLKKIKKVGGKKGGMSPSFPFSFHPTPSILLLPPMLPMQCKFQELATTYFIHFIYGEVLDYYWFKSKFAILNILKASIYTKLSNPRISMLSVIKEDHIVEDVQFRSSTVWSSNPIQPLSSIHSNPNSSKHNCKKKK